MILYILGFIILCILLFFMYIRLKYQFWAQQPVFHFYDVYYWFYNKGIIMHKLPEKNRYINFKSITVKEFDKLTNEDIKELTLTIRLNYLRNKDNIYDPKQENIVPYFIGHNTKSYWSFYWQPELLLDNKTSKTIEINKLIGVMSSRPLHVKIIGKGELDVYYVDYLCVDKFYRKKNIAPQIIQTHEYHQRHNNKNISVSLFKREEELTGIIPLTVYKIYCFNMRNWTTEPTLSPHIKLLTGDKQNMYYLYNFINENLKRWDIVIYPEISNLMELVATKNMYIKMLVVEGEIEAIYIFKKTCTYIEKGAEILSCVCSINRNLSNEEFINGFKVSLWSLIKKESSFKYLVIENISENEKIINNICIKTHPIIISPCAYFFYNFAYNSFNSRNCIIIN